MLSILCFQRFVQIDWLVLWLAGSRQGWSAGCPGSLADRVVTALSSVAVIVPVFLIPASVDAGDAGGNVSGTLDVRR
jgi:hypothetical protein